MPTPHKYGPNLQVIGVTGGIGSGKSAVMDVLARRGLAVVRADDIAHKAMLPGTRAHRQIIDHFGDGVLTPEGTIDRERLAEIVFADLKELAVLNAIVHPPVIEQLGHCFEEIAASGDRMTVAVEVPLLVEAGMVEMVDAIVLVTAPRDARLARMAADGWSKDRVLSIMNAQAADAQKAKFADVIIDNGGSVAELEDKVDEALAQIRDGVGR